MLIMTGNLHPQNMYHGHFLLSKFVHIFQVKLNNYGHLKSTKLVASKTDVVGQDVGVVHSSVYQEVCVAMYKLCAFFSFIYTTMFPDGTF